MSFVQNIEEAIEELSDWAVETVLAIIDEIMPDGKPFFLEPKTLDEQLEEYYGVRGNPEAWTKWMAEQTGMIIVELQESAVPPDMIISVHPVDIAQKTAIKWSADMEDEIATNPDYRSISEAPLAVMPPPMSEVAPPPTPAPPPTAPPPMPMPPNPGPGASMLTGVL